MKLRRLISATVVITLVWLPVVAFAADDLDLTVEVTVECDLASFQAMASGGLLPYQLSWDYGDAESDSQLQEADEPVGRDHRYPAVGAYDWTLVAADANGLNAHATGTVIVDGPVVTLNSDPFPPLLELVGGQASALFTAEVSGGTPPYRYEWDLDGDGQADDNSDPSQASLSFEYSEAGKYAASVRVTDACDMTAEATLPVVVVDPEAEVCHPMAQRIADAVNSLFPDQAESLYTCLDIYDIFLGGLTGSHLGFGRMWHAYKLTQTIQELSWEEIRDWHLNQNGWGGLVQLSRFAEALDQIGVRELFDLVVNGDAGVGDIRHAVQAVTRYGAEFDEALGKLQDGMSPGELGRYYRAVEQFNLDSATLDQYLADGSSLQQIEHAARVAERTGSDWEQVAQAHESGHSWGEIQQAMRQADDGDWLGVLETGAHQSGGNQHQENQNHPDRDSATASRLARQYGVDESEVWSLLNVSCNGDWNCVRAALRGAHGKGGPKPKD